MHKQKLIGGFTKKYGVTMLVYFQYLDTMAAAIGREKQLKEWKRAWKIELIESNNPRWIDLFGELCGSEKFPAERGSKTKRRKD
jgi:putative endonuclease